jgi:hypothetical protein
MKPSPEQTQLVSQERQIADVPQMTKAPSMLNILELAVRGGITGDNVAVVKELAQLCREQRAEEAKAAFAKAFFQLRKNMPAIYADKEAKDRQGNVVYTYCSEEELSKALEPHLMTYGFAMLFGQASVDGRITVNVTLMHEAGHSETREFTVRSGTPNAMKDGAMCDAGGATTAWRHLMIKMFGLKSRLQAGAPPDARIDGEKIAKEKALYLRELVRETNTDEKRFLEYAGAPTFEDIGEARYDDCARLLHKKQLMAK